MIKVCIIGSGNVAQHLITAFLDAEKAGGAVCLVQVYSRQKESVAHLLDSHLITTDIHDIAEADLYILSVSDDVIAELSQQFILKIN